MFTVEQVANCKHMGFHPRNVRVDMHVDMTADIFVNMGTKPIYIRFTNNPVVKTVEIEKDLVMADYDESNRLIGLEILGRLGSSNGRAAV